MAGLELVYGVRGGRERAVPLGGDGSQLSVTGKHTVYLEDLNVKPGDFVAFYARARDVGRGKRPTQARSDIYFLEVTPFIDEFAPSAQGWLGIWTTKKNRSKFLSPILFLSHRRLKLGIRMGRLLILH